MTAAIDHLYRIARLILRDTDRAEDAVQEALVRCWRDLRTLREPDRFDAWLNRLLLRSVTDEARRTRRHDVSVDGFLGKQLDIELPEDVDFATCHKVAGKTDGDYFVWGSPEASGNNLYAQGPGEHRRLRILDVDGTRIIVLNNFYPGTAQADLDEAQTVIDSIAITP